MPATATIKDGSTHDTPFKIDAEGIDEVTTSISSATYVDPNAGDITVADFYADWSARQVWVHKTRVMADLTARCVPFGDVPLGRRPPSLADGVPRQP